MADKKTPSRLVNLKTPQGQVEALELIFTNGLTNVGGDLGSALAAVTLATSLVQSLPDGYFDDEDDEDQD